VAETAFDNGKVVGIEEGQRIEKIQTAQKMLSAGLDIPLIASMTDLSIDEIQSLN
jgi:predicted transposase/invertase (TIGR01784 family)